MPNEFYRLHEVVELKPEAWRNAKAVGRFDAKTQKFIDFNVRQPIKDPCVIGVCLICSRCGRWEPVEPCPPTKLQEQMEAKGWREKDDGDLCKHCSRDH